MTSSLRLFRLFPRGVRRFSVAKTPFPGDAVLVPETVERSEVDASSVPPVPQFDSALISHLERLSLLRFSNEEAVANLRESVSRANRLQLTDVTRLEPMYTVWEDQECPLHDDTPEEPMEVKQVLSNASLTVEDYFVTPPGNVPLEDSDTKLDFNLINKWDKMGVASLKQPKKRRDHEK